jgi:hypothetical protein
VDPMREDTIKPQMQRAGSDRPARCLQQRIREVEAGGMRRTTELFSSVGLTPSSRSR